MRSQWRINRMVVLLLCFSLNLSACIQPIPGSPPALQANQRLAKLTGSWQVETTVVKQAATFPSLLTFSSDGIVIADEPPSPFETSGHGNWVATGPDTADFTFLALIGSAEGPLSSTIKVVGSVNYDSSADTWEGPFTVQVTDAQGAELLADQGAFKGTRITIEKTSFTAQGLKPGDKIGEMVVSKGPDPFDLNIPPYVAFCNANPELEADPTVAKPGVYTVECAVPPLPKMMIGFGWVTNNEQALNEQWPAIHTELYVNGQMVDQTAFGSLDGDVPISAASGEDASKVITMKLRTWNVALENLKPGQFELRYVWNVVRELSDEVNTIPKGIYDITYKITVDASLAASEGTPAPVELLQQATAVFNAFNAAVNAHDVDKALSFFAEDAIAQFPNQPPPNVNKGSAQIRTWLENDAKDNIHVEIENSKTSGDTVRATAKVDIDSLPPDLILVGTVEVTVKDGKITAFSYTLDDETLAKLAALEGK